MACKSCSKRKKRSRVSGVSATDLDFKRIGAYGGGALLGAMTNNIAVKIFKPAVVGDKMTAEEAKKKDAQSGMLWSGIKLLGAGYLAATADDDTVQDLAVGACAGAGLELAMYAFAVPVQAYPNGVKPAVKGIGYSPYQVPSYIPAGPSYDPMMPETHVAGFQEAAGHYQVAGARMAGSGMA